MCLDGQEAAPPEGWRQEIGPLSELPWAFEFLEDETDIDLSLLRSALLPSDLVRPPFGHFLVPSTNRHIR